MSAREFIFEAWEWRPGTIGLCLVLLAAYGFIWRFKSARGNSYFAAGLVLLVLTLASPLHALSDTYLFSAHMLMHLLLLLVVPFLLVKAIPARETLAGEPARRRLHPMLAWVVGLGAMWIWHQPQLFQIAHDNARVHEAHIMSLLVAGTLFWWPIIGPGTAQRLAPLPAVFYLFTACLGCTILGIGITFAPVGLYSAYIDGEDPFGIRLLIRSSWGMTPAVDQQVGGLMMWVPPCFMYASVIMSMLARMYRGEDLVLSTSNPLRPQTTTKKTNGRPS